jgi:hypothetical protein
LIGERTIRQNTDWLRGEFSEQDGKSDALTQIGLATRRADAKAARLLAERECPSDLIEWGKAHGIPTFAEVTWQSGFLAGMRVAMLDTLGETL